MATGTVEWFSPTEGFSSIRPDAGGGDVFVHNSALQQAGMGDLPDESTVGDERMADTRTDRTSAGHLDAR